MAPDLHALFEAAMGGVALGLEAAAAFIILVAGLRALGGFVLRTVRPSHGPSASRSLRHEFGRSLLLALDFTIGSDLLRVALAPSLQAVGLAGLVVLVRIALTLVLEYELNKEKETAEADVHDGRAESDAFSARTRRNST